MGLVATLPATPLVDKDGYISRAWSQWMLNPVVLSLGVVNQTITSGSVADQSVSVQSVVAGFSFTFTAGVQTVIFDSAGVLATGTVVMPASPADGAVVRINSTQTITALTVSPNTGQTIKNAPTALTVSTTGPQGYSFVYKATTSTWYRLQ